MKTLPILIGAFAAFAVPGLAADDPIAGAPGADGQQRRRRRGGRRDAQGRDPLQPDGRQGGDPRLVGHRARLWRLLSGGQPRSGAQLCLAEDLGGPRRVRGGARQVPGQRGGGGQGGGQGGSCRQGGLRRGGDADLRQLQVLPRGLSHGRTEAGPACGGWSARSSFCCWRGRSRSLSRACRAAFPRRCWRRCPPATRRAARPGSGPAAAPPAMPPPRPRARSGCGSAAGRCWRRRSATSWCRTSRPTRRTASAAGRRRTSPTRCCAGSRRTGGTSTRRFPMPPTRGCGPRTSPTSGRFSRRCPRSPAGSPGTP